MGAIWDAVGSERAARSCDSSVATLSSAASADGEGAEMPDEWRRRQRVFTQLNNEVPKKRAVIDDAIECALCRYNPNFLAAFLTCAAVGYGVYAVALLRNLYGWTEHLYEVRQG